MAKTTFQCWVELDQSGNLTSTCFDDDGNEVFHPIGAKKGDDFVWHASNDIQSIDVTYYEGQTKSKPCNGPPFKNTNANGRQHKGTEINQNCTDKISYQIDAVVGTGTVTLDPIIIVGKANITDYLAAATGLLVAIAVAAIAYRMGRKKERRIQAGGSRPTT